MSESTGAGESWNDTVIREFREGKARIVNRFDRPQLLLLHSTGARSGERRTSPLAYLTLDDQIVIMGSNGGRDPHPSWYHNLLAHPEATIERWRDDAIESIEVKAVPTEGAERDRLWQRVIAIHKGFAAYESQTSRVIPVVILQPR